MLNEKKVKLMTKIAIREKNEGRELKIASGCFKVDYVTLQMVYTAISVTIGYILIVVLYALAHLEELLLNAEKLNYYALIETAVTNYVLCLFAFLLIAFFYYAHKYDKAFVKVKHNYSDLKSLSKMMEK